MINDANRYLDEFEQQSISLPYKYIIIDEFQDIARQRFELTKRLSEITCAKVVAVGDDWQSIFAFAGSDITLFTRFLELMGSGTEMQITHTYRNSQELIDIAGGFIQKNATQIRKRLKSPKNLAEPIVLEEFDDSTKPFLNLAKAVEHIIGKLIAEYGNKQEILLLGRYNFDGFKLANTNLFEQINKKGDSIRCKTYPKVKLTFMTAHGSKGLGFDNVIILNMFEGKFGFPSQIENDPIMKLVSYDDNSVPYAEERRLFYVALTRTKNRVYIATPQNKASRFLIELVNDYKLKHSDKLNKGFIDLFPHRCPICNYPLKYEFNKNYGLALYLCTNEVEVCDFMTNHQRHLYDIFKCNGTGCDGYMIVRTKDDAPFYGCSNYLSENPCRETMSITSRNYTNKNTT
jgi:DNA helicase-4